MTQERIFFHVYVKWVGGGGEGHYLFLFRWLFKIESNDGATTLAQAAKQNSFLSHESWLNGFTISGADVINKF